MDTLVSLPSVDLDRLVVETADDFRVSGRVYTDPELFKLEMKAIFGRCWIFLGHESEIAKPGDFKTAYMGLTPVILSRGENGQIHAMLNRCRHRGSVICRGHAGTAKRFQCAYHGWVYGLDGALLGIAKHKGGYPDDFDKASFGLTAVPRVQSYRGLVFANLDPGAPDLIDYLGEARHLLDIHLDRAPDGEIELTHGAHRTEYRGNWKLQVENSTDGYHGDVVHESFFKLVAEFGNKGGQHGAYVERSLEDTFKHRLTGRTQGFDNGHSMWESPLTPDGVEAMRAGPHRGYIEWMEGKYGTQRTHEMLNSMNLVIFPSLAVLHGQLRVMRPISVDRTEVSIHFFKLKGASEAYNNFRLASHQRFFGPASFGSPDDVEIFAVNQTGLQADEVDWVLLSRGMGRETMDNNRVRTAEATDETPQRAFHRGWKQFMGS